MERIPSFQQKAELNLQLRMTLQLYAAQPAGSLYRFCVPHAQNIRTQLSSVGVKEYLQNSENWSENERQNEY